uniref:Uncharacterized protein n=1 Tax=Tanacetum cinerariifolium TaxID=118510 RepID=A0A6L2LMB3_TANCI|nr:hypothetical protein [Tanacetum cinerariifolium]
MHTFQDDSILGSLRFFSKTKEYQVYRALIPAWMTNRKMLNSTAYKTYLAFATGATTPKKARKFKKPASYSKKKTLVAVEEPAEKPTKKFAARDSLLLFKSEILLLKKAIKQSKQETNIHQESGSSEGAGIELEVPNEQKGKSSDTSEGIGLIPGVPDVSKADSSKSEYESWGDSDDDNNDDDQQSDDEQNVSYNLRTNDEEYERINKEIYDDVNVELKVVEPADKGKGDEEMSDVEQVDAKNEKVNQEVAGDQVNDDAQATVIVALSTQKTEVPLQSSSISSDYATKFLNFDNIPLADTEIISMMDIKVQHEDPSSQTLPLLTVHVLVIPESLTASATTILSPIPPFIPLPQQSTPILTPTTTKATISTTYDPDSSLLLSIKDFLTWKMKSRHSKILDDNLHKKRVLFETMAASKTFNKHPKHKALYHALMESLLMDKDTMDKGVADIQKKRKPDDADRDEDPPAGPDQGLKKRKICKEAEPSKKAKLTETSKGLQNLEEDMSNTDEPPVVKADLKDWFKKLERPPTDPEWNECKTIDNKPTQKWLSDLAKAEKSSKTFNDIMSTPIDFSVFTMNCLYISDLTQDILALHIGDPKDKPSMDMLVTGNLERIKVQRSDHQLYKFMEGDFPRLYLNDIEDMLLIVI